MVQTVLQNPETDGDYRVLAVAALFDREFSIDWVQDITQFRASHILKALERKCKNGILVKKGVDFFCFTDLKKKREICDSLPSKEREHLHRQIANLLLRESTNEESVKQAVAEQLLYVTNDLDGCRMLREAGDYYRRDGHSGKALICYEKIIHDLNHLIGVEADILFIETVIGYSKDLSALRNPGRVVSYLEEALKRAERWDKCTLQALVLIHLASNEWIRENYDKALKYFKKGCSLAKNIEYPDLERSLITITVIYHFNCGRFKEAIKTFETNEPVFAQKYPRYKMSLRTGLFLGVSYCLIGQVSQGLGLLDGIRSHALKIKDYETANIASANIGLVFMCVQNFDEAIKHLIQALKNEKKSSTMARCFISYFLAYSYFKKQSTKQSHRYLKDALRISNNKKYNIRCPDSSSNFNERCKYLAICSPACLYFI